MSQQSEDFTALDVLERPEPAGVSLAESAQADDGAGHIKSYGMDEDTQVFIALSALTTLLSRNVRQPPGTIALASDSDQILSWVHGLPLPMQTTARPYTTLDQQRATCHPQRMVGC